MTVKQSSVIEVTTLKIKHTTCEAKEAVSRFALNTVYLNASWSFVAFQQNFIVFLGGV